MRNLFNFYKEFFSLITEAKAILVLTCLIIENHFVLINNYMFTTPAKMLIAEQVHRFSQDIKNFIFV